jgi:hypothetical protein
MRRRGLTLVVLAVLWPAAVSGQVAWDSPLLLPPRPQPGAGIFLADMAGGGLGVIGMWRSAAWNYGVRLGLAEDRDDDVSVFGGLDYTGRVNRATNDFPIDIDWVFGAGLAIGDAVLVSLPLGLTGAHTFVGDGARFTPYFTPRVVLDAWFGDDGRDSNLRLDFAFDLGLDLRLTGGGGPLGGTTIRFGATLGDREAIALGLVF